MISKAKLKEQIENLPDKFTIGELVERLVFMGKVDNGLSDSINNNTISERELEQQMKTWFG